MTISFYFPPYMPRTIGPYMVVTCPTDHGTPPAIEVLDPSNMMLHGPKISEAAEQWLNTTGFHFCLGNLHDRLFTFNFYDPIEAKLFALAFGLIVEKYVPY